MVRNALRNTAILGSLVVLLLAPGCRKKAYENPITKDTQQPDKVLFDTAIDDIEHGRYERARLTLQTLMNTYDTSEYLAKAKLALADSWYREGGTHGLAQAEAEYKDFILFYQNMEEAAEAQAKICKMQYQQMDKSDRDPLHAYRAQEECKQVVLQFPNSKFVPEALQYMRNVQEVLADEEYRVGQFYLTKGSYPAAANRLQALTDQFPLYSRASDALWMQAESYLHMGDNFENQQAAAYTKLVKDYALSPHADEAAGRLRAMKRPVPEMDPVAYALQKHEMENRQKRSLLGKVWGPFSSRPDTTRAARAGTPTMEGLRPTVPASVPALAAGARGTSANPLGGTSSDVTVSVQNDSKLIDTAPEARSGVPTGQPANATPAAAATAPGGVTPAGTAPATPAATAQTTADPAAQVTPQNHTGKPKSLAQQEKEMLKQQAEMKKVQSRQKKQQEEQMKALKKAAEREAKKKKDSKDQTPPAPTPAAAPIKQ